MDPTGPLPGDLTPPSPLSMNGEGGGPHPPPLSRGAGEGSSKGTPSPSKERGSGGEVTLRAPGALVARWLVPLVAFAVAFSLAFFQLHDDDAGFHVATGRLVRAAWAEGAPVPTTNPFSYADPGAPWVQHQQVPAAAIAWLVDDAPRLLGLPSSSALPNASALVTAKALLVGALFALLALAALAEGLPAAPALLLSTLGAVAACPRFYERPLLASALLLAVTGLGLSHHARRGGVGGLLLAGAATWLNGHLHAGVLDALLLWSAAAAGALLDAALHRRPRGRTPPPRPRAVLAAFGLTLALLAGSLAAFAPSGLEVLLLPARFSTDAWWNEHLLEFRPLWQAFGKLPYATAWVAVAGLATALACRSLRAAEGLVVVGFGALALKHQRMLLPFVVATLPVVARAVSVVLARAATHAGTALRRAAPPLTVALAAAVSFGGVVAQGERFVLGLGPANEHGIDPRAHPFALLDRLETARLPDRVFVSDGFAGTFLWRFFPARQVLVHNVIEAYRPGTYRDAYMAVRYAEPGFERRLGDLGIRSFLLKHASPGERRLQAGRPNLRDVLAARSGTGAFPDAVLIDFDDAGALWTLRDALPPGTPSFDGLGVNPDTLELGPTPHPDRRLAALVEHARAHPDCLRCRALARKALQQSAPPGG